VGKNLRKGEGAPASTVLQFPHSAILFAKNCLLSYFLADFFRSCQVTPAAGEPIIQEWN